jgi:hypothetical protein
MPSLAEGFLRTIILRDQPRQHLTQQRASVVGVAAPIPSLFVMPLRATLQDDVAGSRDLFHALKKRMGSVGHSDPKPCSAVASLGVDNRTLAIEEASEPSRIDGVEFTSSRLSRPGCDERTRHWTMLGSALDGAVDLRCPWPALSTCFELGPTARAHLDDGWLVMAARRTSESILLVALEGAEPPAAHVRVKGGSACGALDVGNRARSPDFSGCLHAPSIPYLTQLDPPGELHTIAGL